MSTLAPTQCVTSWLLAVNCGLLAVDCELSAPLSAASRENLLPSLESKPHAELRSEGNTDRGAGPEEVAQRASGNK